MCACDKSPGRTRVDVEELKAALGPALVRARHILQRESWDCGIACLVMLGWSWEEVAEACGTRSIWTVDLARALELLGAKFVFATKTIGCDPSYGRLPFYSRDLDSDVWRVRERFESATFQVVQARVTNDALLGLLNAGYCVIALVDLRLLRETFALWSYTGHYVLLYGVRSGMVLYFDPGSSSTDLAIAPADLQKARAAHGTDEDLLIVAG